MLPQRAPSVSGTFLGHPPQQAICPQVRRPSSLPFRERRPDAAAADEETKPASYRPRSGHPIPGREAAHPYRRDNARMGRGRSGATPVNPVSEANRAAWEVPSASELPFLLATATATATRSPAPWHQSCARSSRAPEISATRPSATPALAPRRRRRTARTGRTRTSCEADQQAPVEAQDRTTRRRDQSREPAADHRSQLRQVDSGHLGSWSLSVVSVPCGRPLLSDQVGLLIELPVE